MKMRKTFLLLLVLCLTLGALVFTASAADVVSSGSCGEALTWELDSEGTLTICGEGDMTDYAINEGQWYAVRDTIEKIVIQEGVTGIGKYAFQNFSNLTEISIPEGVTRIGTYAFYKCEKLAQIKIPSTVTSIGTATFEYCKSITEVEIPQGVTRIENSLFMGCTSLESVTIPENVTHLGGSAFWECGNLKSIALPEKLTYIGPSALHGCTSLTEIIIPKGVTRICNGAFSGCANVTSITIPETVTTLEGSVFTGCSSLKSVSIPEGITMVGNSLFSGCTSLESMTLPTSVEKIYDDAFAYCSSLKSITIPNKVTSIGQNAFFYCTNLKSITLPENLTGLGKEAFAYCTSLESIAIPGGVTELETYTFGGCEKLVSISLPENMTVIGDSVFEGCSSLTQVILPKKLTSFGEGVYKGCSSLVHGEIPACAAAVEDEMFSGCTNLKSVTISDGVTSIGSSAFSGCSSLTDFTIPSSVTSIGFSAFSGCSSLTDFTIPSNVTSIGNSAFSECSGLKSITIQAGVKKIAETLFSDCSSLESVELPSSVTSIARSAFRDCASLKSITIPTGVTAIEGGAFLGCTSLENIKIPTTVTSIGSNAFDSCASLKSITIPDGVTAINYGTFAWCTGLESIKIPDGITSIADSAFVNCRSLKSITIPAGVTSIGFGAFENCFSLESITIPDSVTVLRNSAFRNCDGLKSAVIGKGITSIEAYVFYDCDALVSVSLPGTLKSTGNSAFSSCASLTDFYLSDLVAWLECTHTNYPLAVNSKQKNLYLNGELLTDVVIPAGVTKINMNTFYQSSIVTLSIPDTVSSIEKHAFYDCEELTEVTIARKTGAQVLPEGGTSIGEFAFFSCDKLSTVTLLEGVTSIEKNGFASCQNITAITLPKSLTSVDTTAFAQMKNLSDIHISDLTHWMQWPLATNFLTANTQGKKLYLNDQLITELQIPAGVTQIGTNAFYSCSSITSVSIPDTVSSIQKGAFSGCTGLNKLAIGVRSGSDALPQGGTVIGDNAFQNSSALTEVTLYEGVTGIGSNAFSGCGNLERISLPKSLTTIGASAFNQCKKLTDIYITDLEAWLNANFGAGPLEANDTEKNLYLNGQLLTQVTIPETITQIRPYAFYLVSSITDVSFPDDLESIGDMSFAGCGKLTHIDLPEGLTGIGNAAFGLCPGLSHVDIPDSVTSLGMGAFLQCVNLESVELPAQLTQIDMLTFGMCSELTRIIIPDTVNVIGEGAFHSCGKLKHVLFLGEAPQIHENAFIAVNTNAYYSAGDETWTQDKTVNYGGTITWSPWVNLSITAQPETIFLRDGEQGQLTVSAAGSGLDYQWYFKAAGESQFTKTDVTEPAYPVTMDANTRDGYAYCVITDVLGNSVTTETARVHMAVTILTQPQNAEATVGQVVSVELTAAGDDLRYTWYQACADEDFTCNSAVTDRVYTVEMTQALDGLRLYCVVEDKFGNSQKSDEVMLTCLLPDVTITTQPKTTYTKLGAKTNVTVEAQGEGLTYTWYYKNANGSKFVKSTITGATYKVTMQNVHKDRYLYCVVTDQYGTSVQTETVRLHMAATITRQPEDVLVRQGKNAAPSVTAVGDGLTYTWYYKDVGSSSYKISTNKGSTCYTTMTAARNGRQVYCVVKDQYGNTDISQVVTLTCYAPVKITTQPKTTYTKLGAKTNVTVEAQGEGLTYTWYYKNANGSRFNKSSITKPTYSVIMSNTYKDRYLYCVVTDQYGNSVRTETVRLRLAATITKQPEDVLVRQGKNAAPSVTAVGDGLTYTWYYKDVGASKYKVSTNKGNVCITTITAARNGRQVYCVVKDQYGSTDTSQVVTLTCYTPVKITTQPKTTYTKLGAKTNVTVEAQGEGLSYTWYYKNAGASKFTKSTIAGAAYKVTMQNVHKDRYLYCVVTDQYGNSVRTETVRLRVAATITKQPVNVTVAKGAKTNIKVTAAGDGLTYKWYYKDVGSSKFLASSFKGAAYATSMTKGKNGRQVYCVVTDQYGNSVKSNVVTIRMK